MTSEISEMSETNPESTVESKSILHVINEDIGPIPPYLMHLLEFLGYNTYDTLKDFSIKDVDDIERFVRDDLSRLITDTVAEKKKYFGPYHGFPKIFRILPGHKKLILSVPAYMKGAHNENVNREHFVRRLKGSHQQHLQRTSFKRSIDSLSSTIEETEESGQSTSRNAFAIVDDDDDSPLVKPDVSHLDEMVNDEKRIRLEENSTKTQKEERRIRDTINRWLLNVKPQLKSNTNIPQPICYSIVFYSRPKEGKMSATIECCMCHIQIGISSHRNKNGSRRWLISNFMRHVKKTHYQVQQHTQQQQINIVDITLVKKEVDV